MPRKCRSRRFFCSFHLEHCKGKKGKEILSMWHFTFLQTTEFLLPRWGTRTKILLSTEKADVTSTLPAIHRKKDDVTSTLQDMTRGATWAGWGWVLAQPKSNPNCMSKSEPNTWPELKHRTITFQTQLQVGLTGLGPKPFYIALLSKGYKLKKMYLFHVWKGAHNGMSPSAWR